MAVTTQTLVDAADDLVIKITKKFTNTTNESATNIVDVSGLAANAGGTACSAVAIQKVKAQISGVTVELLWDATTDVSCLKLDGDVDMDYSDVPGERALTNNSAAGKTGDLLLTTTGAASGDFFNIVLYCLKKY